MTETRRNSSRRRRRERWTSTAGRAVELQGVADRPRVVRPCAGIEDDAVREPSRRCRCSTKAPSKLVWKNRVSRPELVRVADLLLQAVEVSSP